MRAISLLEYGGSNKLSYGDLPVPKVGPDTVLVRVRAAGVNPVDWKLREGYLDAAFDSYFPIVPGWDLAGVVERVGPAVREFAPGDEVIGYVRRDEIRHGTYAEFTPAPVRALARKPRNANWFEAAGLPLVGLTAYQALMAVDVGAGDIVLVHAAAGGVGHAAVQIARILGARVIGTASPRNHEFLRGLGAEPVSYGPDLVRDVRAIVPDGVDAALDLVGGDALAASFELTEDPRRVVSVTDYETVLANGGRYIYARGIAAHLEQLASWVDEGQLRVVVERPFLLEAAAAAQDYVRTGHVRGKVVLEVG